MKEKITDDLKSMLGDARRWWEMELNYVKLTAAEKFTVLMSTLVLGALCLFVAIIALTMFSFSLAEVFKNFLSPGLAYLSVGGIFILLMVVLYLLRRQLVFNPIARLITRLIIDKNE